MLDILYRDDCLVAINKPSGLLVHRSNIDRHETRFALQLLRDQIGQRVPKSYLADCCAAPQILLGVIRSSVDRNGNIPINQLAT
ncbi:MAG: hypothetical protein Q8O52_01790 [Sulfuritalea sp.]|nr:hypothetical protein [Sulfuritalea sp.]